MINKEVSAFLYLVSDCSNPTKPKICSKITGGFRILFATVTSIPFSARVRPILDPFEQRDGILVIGDDEKTIHVHRKVSY